MAVPISGPWMKIADAIEFVRKMSPMFVIPVHDAILSKKGFELYERLIKNFSGNSVRFIPLRKVGDSHEFKLV